MRELVRYGPDVALGPAPTVVEIEALERAGFRSLICLDVEGEEHQALSPNVEATWAHTFELRHERLSVDPHFLDPGLAQRFRALLARIEKPVYVHSRDGRRAAALMAIELGRSRGLTGAQALEQAAQQGFPSDDERLRAFVVREVERGRANVTAR
jgi:protein tyrosine phosphatase (PTP) superfamily phosphohydrolase (DUF442 family)